MLWIYDVPLWLLATLILLICIGYAVAVVALVRRRRWRLAGDDNGVAAALHAFVGVLYAVALGLLVVSSQEANSDVEAAVTREANATGDLFRALAGLEPANRDHMQRELAAYVLLVVNDEWPATQRAETSVRTWTAIDRLSREIYTFQPTTPREERVYPLLTHEIEEVLDARRDRLFLGQQGVGAVTWTIIVLGGLITIGFASFFGMENPRAQTFLTALAASMFGLMIFLLLAMDHPLWGKVSVEPGPFLDLESGFVRMHAEQASMPAPVTAAPPAR
jgi:hypothetical protein